LVQSGTIWQNLVHSRTIWDAPDTNLAQSGTFGTIWHALLHFGTIYDALDTNQVQSGTVWYTSSPIWVTLDTN